MASGICRLVAVVLCLSVILTGVASGTVVDAAVSSRESATLAESSRVSSPSPFSAWRAAIRSPAGLWQTNNTTALPQHKRPSQVDADGDTDALKRWLRSRMAGQLQQSSMRLSRGEYDLAKQAVGPDYREHLGQYVEVAADTDESADDEVGKTFERTRDQQREFVNQTERFNRVYADLQAARAAGDEQRARRLARRLNRIGTDAQQTSANLTDNYAQLETQTGANLSTATTQVTAVTENITETRQQTLDDLFVETRLRIEADQATGSFADPITLSGSLTVVDNASLPDRARIQIGTATQTVELTPHGSFTVEYRPVTAPVGFQTLTVRYRPANESVYLPATDTVTATIENVSPTVAIAAAPATVRYGESVGVTGRISVGEEPVPRVPVRIQLADDSLARTRTDTSGRYAANRTLPATVPPGDRSLTVAAGNRSQAVDRATRTQRIEVVESPVSLSLTATEQPETVQVSGTLTTTRGVPVRNQPVAIRIDGSDAETVLTESDGTYQTTVALPARRGHTVTIQAVFDGTGTNLGDARTTANVTVGSATAAESSGLLFGIDRWTIGVGIGGLLVLVVLVVFFRQRSSADDAASSTTGSDRVAADPSPTDTTTREGLTLDERIEAVVTSASSPDEMAIGAFLELRSALDESTDVPAGATHWEFYDALVDRDQSLAEPMAEIVSGYERAVYAPGSISTVQAQRVVESAVTVATQR